MHEKSFCFIMKFVALLVGRGADDMATYVVSDIHGMYDKFIKLLHKIGLNDDDTLYVLGDVLDRDPNPIKVLQKLMEMPNVVPIVGNHELMAIECLDFLCKEITPETIEDISTQMINNFVNWDYNGSATTIAEFAELDKDMKKEVLDFIKDFSLYEEVEVTKTKAPHGTHGPKKGDKVTYLLVHAGLGHYSPTKEIDDYTLDDIIWERADYDIPYYPDRKNFYVINGHTPTQLIETNPKPGFIYREYNHIAIDCGACFKEGRLAAICLETDKEYYVS